MNGEVLALLLEGHVRVFAALQPHQQQPWFSFLVQLAAMGVARENDGETPEDVAAWRDVLLGLADESESAWHLVVDTEGGAVTVGFSRLEAAEKAYYHSVAGAGKSETIRDFMGLTPEEEDQVAEIVEEAVTIRV